ncbi:MAG TPA: UvrD-helicase domain-containing protein [Rectinemataceae bacterium]|nr:UvrD-helicase domain-containing protein [Rectinemataceae bacterium]
MSDWLDSLNPEQLEAVRHEGSPLLILAGAGSGKTRVITTKIAWLVRERGFEPESILAVTFTNKAAKEMRDRAAAIEPECSRSTIRTFHSFGAWFLRRNAKAVSGPGGAVPGLDSDFTIYDDDDQTTLLHGLLPRNTRSECRAFVEAISRAKDFGFEVDSPALDKVSSDPGFRRIYAMYEERLRATGNVDFGDLIRLPSRILREDPAIARRTRQRFRVVLVDEYQDSNVAQFELLRLLAGYVGSEGSAADGRDAGPSAYVCVVGDDDQSIYRFRGAEVRNILSFPEVFPNTKVVRLERNYRSWQSILNVAGAVVAHNEGRLGKTLRAVRPGGSKPRLALLEDQDREVAYCLRVAEDARRKGRRWNDIAILYRTNAQSLGFEKEFAHRGVPYRIVGALRFYEREEVKDVLAWLALLANPRDEVAYKRVVNKPARGIGDTSVDLILRAAGAGGNLLRASQEEGPSLKGKARTGIAEFSRIAFSLAAILPAPEPASTQREEDGPRGAEAARAEASLKMPKEPPPRHLGELVDRLVKESGLLDYHRGQDEIAGTQKVANLDELVNAASLYPLSRAGLADFLETVELDRSLAAADGEGAIDAVTLITMHNTKGLEFPLVMVTGLEQGLFPRDNEEGEDLEEQRRLFYVACTRAKDELHLTACRLRRMRGRLFETLPSRFLGEIPMELLDPVGGGGWRGGASAAGAGAFAGAGRLGGGGAAGKAAFGKDAAAFSKQAPASAGGKGGDEWRVGTAVYHDDYGPGVVAQVKPTPSSGPLLVVRFETGKEAKFFPAFTAKLERLR